MDDLKWQSLNRLLEAILEANLKSEDSIRLVSQLVLELESLFPYIKTGSESFPEITNSYNQNEELE